MALILLLLCSLCAIAYLFRRATKPHRVHGVDMQSKKVKSVDAEGQETMNEDQIEGVNDGLNEDDDDDEDIIDEVNKTHGLDEYMDDHDVLCAVNETVKDIEDMDILKAINQTKIDLDVLNVINQTAD